MARKKPEESGPSGAPDWMLTFSDCMTLLLTFFVLLMSFASFDENTLPELGEAFSRIFPGVGVFGSSVERSMMKKNTSKDEQVPTKGSETRTLAKKINTNFMKEKKPLDFRNLKVFTMESEKVFWGKGVALTQAGMDTMKALEKFFLSNTGRIVISEVGPGQDTGLGLERAVMIMKYFEAGGVDKNRISISIAPTTSEEVVVRRLEITLLERSVYE